MSNIPQNRSHLMELIDGHFDKLLRELEDIDDTSAAAMCDEDFSIKDILAVRVWWSEAVIKWIKAGQQGKTLPIPAKGYSWKETPALNLATAQSSKTKKTYTDIKRKLIASKRKVCKLIESLSDEELTQVGVYEWAGKWPVMRWVSVSTSTQYDGARKLIRKAKRSMAST